MDVSNESHLAKKNDDNHQTTHQRIFAYKICKQVCFFGIWLCMGLSSGINGPALPDFMNNLDVDYEQISRGLACESIGFCFGAVMGGIVFEIFHKHRDLLIFFSEMLLATGMFAIPWVTTLWQFGAIFFIVGFSDGYNNSGINAVVLHLWGNDAGAPMFFMHFGFGVGALIVPQIARPFLSEVPLNIQTPFHSGENISGSIEYSNPEDIAQVHANLSNAFHQSVTPISNAYTTEHELSDENVSLFYPYTIVGVVTSIVAFAFLLFHIKGTPASLEYHPKRTFKAQFKRLCKKQSFGKLNKNNILILLLFCLLFFQAIGGEHIYSNFLFSFATKTDVSFTKDQATNLTSLFWIMFMIGRFAGGVTELCLSTRLIIFIDLILLIVTSFLLVIFGHYSGLALWVLTASLGLFIGPIFPAAMVLSNMYLKINSITTMVFILGCSAGLWTYVYFGGYMFNTIGPKSMMYFEVICGITLISIVTIITVFGRYYLKTRKEGLLEPKHQEHGTSVELPQTLPIHNKTFNKI